jgi:hypothetical protein
MCGAFDIVMQRAMTEQQVLRDTITGKDTLIDKLNTTIASKEANSDIYSKG